MAQAAIADVVAPRERGRYQAYMASMWGVSSIAGPIVGGWVTDHMSWRWVFWANLPFGLLAILLCNQRAAADPASRGARRCIDWGGAGLLGCGGVTAWLLLLSWGGTEFPWMSSPMLAAGGGRADAAGAADAVARGARTRTRSCRRGMFRQRRPSSAACSIAFFTSLGLFGATFLMPLFFQLVLGLRRLHLRACSWCPTSAATSWARWCPGRRRGGSGG